MLAGLAQHQEDVKKSRFLALAGPVGNVAEAQAFIARHSVPDATHNCWAWRLGNEYRFNDDGEPGGTAGRPILQAIEGQDVDRVVVLVVRWFGGVKLGTGGLVRAYGGVAAQCLRLAEKHEIIPEVQVECDCAFGDMALVQSRLPSWGARIESENFHTEGVTWLLALPRHAEPDAARAFTNLTRGQGRWEPS